MIRAEVLQEVRLMKFEDVYSRRTAGKLTQEQAAEILAYLFVPFGAGKIAMKPKGADGLYDRRLRQGRHSHDFGL